MKNLIRRIGCVFDKHEYRMDTMHLTLIETLVEDEGASDIYRVDNECIHCGKHYQCAIKIPILVATEGVK